MVIVIDRVHNYELFLCNRKGKGITRKDLAQYCKRKIQRTITTLTNENDKVIM